MNTRESHIILSVEGRFRVEFIPWLLDLYKAQMLSNETSQLLNNSYTSIILIITHNILIYNLTIYNI